MEPIQKQAEIGEATPKPEQMVVDDEVRQIVTERIGEDAMKEALDRAAKDQAVLPAEVRLQQFRQMLIDKQVCFIRFRCIRFFCDLFRSYPFPLSGVSFFYVG